MTKEITKAIILQQIQDKFKLRDFEAAKFLFDETVVPIYNIDQELEHWETHYSQASVTSGPTAYYFGAVPPTERWVLRGYNIIFMASGAYTVTGLYIVRASSPSTWIYLDMVLGQSASYAVNLPESIVLEPNDKLYIYVDSYTSTADLRLYADTKRVEIR